MNTKCDISCLLLPIDIQTRPTFVREELTEKDLDKMVMFQY